MTILRATISKAVKLTAAQVATLEADRAKAFKALLNCHPGKAAAKAHQQKIDAIDAQLTQRNQPSVIKTVTRYADNDPIIATNFKPVTGRNRR